MYSCTAYGLKISSQIPLPEMVAANHTETEADVIIRHGTLSAPVAEPDRVDWSVRGEDDFYFYYDHAGWMRVLGGSEIIVDALPGIEDSWLRLPLLGTVLSVLLHQRGFFVLHASAVAINGRAVAFVGWKGDGKSTMAATLYARGHTHLTDDLVAVRFDEAGKPQLVPGFPQFKLWPESVASSLQEDEAQLDRLATGYDKCSRLVTERFGTQPLPLDRIYVLAAVNTEAQADPRPEIVSISPQEAMSLLVAHSHAARFGKQMLHGQVASKHLMQCANIIRQVPLRWLKRPRSLELLPEVAQLVEQDVASTG